MKKLAVIALLGSLTSAAVMADCCDSRLYIGGEAQYNHFTLKEDSARNLRALNGGKNPVKKSAAGGGLFVGSRLNENFGVEVGVSGSRKLKGSWARTINGTNSNGKFSIKNTNIYVDGMGYLPMCDNVELIGSLGLGWLISKTDYSFNVNNRNGFVSGLTRGTSTKTGLRAGAGIQYKFDDNVGARLMARIQQGNDEIKTNAQVGLGLFYQF